MMDYRSAALAALVMLTGACGPRGGAAPPSQAAAPQPQAASIEPVQLATSAEAPPAVNGFYEYKGICPGEGGCTNFKWRADAQIDVYERSDAASPVIAKLTVGDRVVAIDGLTRIVPRRGVVRIANQGLEPGDVVYLLDSEGEGAFTLWRRGEQRSWTWPSEQEREADIQWDPQAPDGPALGWWVNVRLADGKTGWVRNPRDFGCMGGLSGDEEGC
ncbi:MAG TPA: hypothetical protein VG735_00140 [Caulobacterales bacterium]|nr:hypothetical protein [Caulobacterales bacterium]